MGLPLPTRDEATVKAMVAQGKIVPVPNSNDTFANVSESQFKGAKPPRKAKRVESQKKLMYVLFFDSKGPIYQHFVPKVRTLLRSLSGTQIWASIS